MVTPIFTETRDGIVPANEGQFMTAGGTGGAEHHQFGGQSIKVFEGKHLPRIM